MIVIVAAMLGISGCVTQPTVNNAAAVSAAATSAAAQQVIVAKVNTAELFMDALLSMMNTLPEKGGGAPETVEERKQRALDSLILLELAYQRAVAMGLAVDPAKIEVALNTIKENAGGEKEYADFLHRRAKTESALRAEIERGFMIELIYTKEVLDMVAVPEDELRKEFDKDPRQFILPEKVSVIDVYLIKNEGRASEKKAKDLLKKITADVAQDPWKLVLDNTFLVRKLVVRRDRDQELYDAAKKLKPQGLSGVLRTSTGLHIIKLEEYTPERPLSFEEAKPKLIAKLKGPYEEKRTREWEQDLKKGAAILLVDDLALQEQKKP